MKIVYAKCLTPEEKRSYFEYFANLNKRKDEEKDVLLAKHSEKLIKEYELLIEETEFAYQEEKAIYDSKLFAMHYNTCVCGSPIIESTDYWGNDRRGCKKHYDSTKEFYDSSGEHWVFKGYEPREPTHRVDSNYLTNMLKKVKLNGRVNAKRLAEFFESKGLGCIREMHGYDHVTKSIGSLQKAKKVSDKFEKQMLEKYKKLYDTVIPQLGIKYKLEGDSKFKYCFLDLLASNSREVHILECKTHSSDKDEDQQKLYTDLISKIENKGRKILFTYLIQNP